MVGQHRMLVNIAFLNMLTLANHAGQHGWPTVNVCQREDMLLNIQHAYFGRPCWSTWLTNIECWSTLLLLFASIVKSTACQHGSMSVMMLVNMVGQHWPMSANIVPTTTPNVVQHSSLPMINVGQHQCRCTCTTVREGRHYGGHMLDPDYDRQPRDLAAQGAPKCICSGH